MPKTHDLVVKIGSYEKDGKTRNRYLNIGSRMESDKGAFFLINRTFSPAGVPNPDNKDSVIVSMFEVKTDNQPQTVIEPEDIKFLE